MQAANRTMTARSKYYNYFNVGEGKAACKNCDSIFPYSSRIGTNSLRNHIKNKHPEIFQTLDSSSWQQNQPNIDENQNSNNYNELAELTDVKPNFFQLSEATSNSTQKPQKTVRKRKSTVQYPECNNGFPFDLQAFLASNQESQNLTNTNHDPEPSNSLYPQDLLNVMAGNDDSDCSNVDEAKKHDVETIAKNLSSMDDALFYLKTTSEIVKKWPVEKVRVFVQNILKQAMEDDNKMRFSSE